MLFKSYAFIFGFLPVVLAGFFLVGETSGRYAACAWLALASLFFYAWWQPALLLLLLASIVGNALLGRAHPRPCPLEALGTGGGRRAQPRPARLLQVRRLHRPQPEHLRATPLAVPDIAEGSNGGPPWPGRWGWGRLFVASLLQILKLSPFLYFQF